MTACVALVIVAVVVLRRLCRRLPTPPEYLDLDGYHPQDHVRVNF